MTATIPAAPHSQPVNQAADPAKGGETTMIKKIQKALFSRRKPIREQPREFNAELLNAHREYVFLLMHQQMRGLN
ncbi:hypothetical protein F8G81_23375 [Arthrobacter sp. CDRTa11]|uniref:hypothetical protein n=1 Tax=Arthrobacter sp. CDRTa11 TaxID=2651199 RepID=UPI002265930F|nr:hypothetical protein [Arthrobacter sp. CDRTa11]UZX05201.1 hypothetical protein F8G81_23375 [Arthrobacter sp. CDRTa11]